MRSSTSLTIATVGSIFASSLSLSAAANDLVVNAAPAEHATSLSLATLLLGATALAAIIAGIHRFSRTGMRRWTVNQRLAAGFVGILLVLTGLAIESYVSLHSALKDFIGYRADARHSNLATEIHVAYLEMNEAAKDLVILQTEEATRRYTAHEAATIALLEEAKASFEEPEMRERINLIEREIADHDRQFQELQKAVTAAQAAAYATINRQMNALGEKIDQEVTSIQTEFLAQQNRDGPRMAAELQHTQSSVIWIGLAAVVLGTALATIIARSITTPLRLVAESIAGGADQTSAAATQVSAASQSLAEGASEQAASLEETSASIEELTTMTQRNADSAVHAKAVSAKTRSAADHGASDMGAMRQAMDAIKASSGEITKIVRTIDEIAFQTNILALNAAVEAARAGEAGAGFAVVAEEVRALAHRSAQAARETGDKIQSAVDNSEQGVRISAQVAESLQEIVQSARGMESLIVEIATASEEQSQGITQMNTAMQQMDQVTQTNAGSAEETAAAAEELNAQAVSMQHAAAELQILVGQSNDSAPPVSGGAAPVARPPVKTGFKQLFKSAAKTGSNPARTLRPSAPATARPPDREELVGAASGATDDFFRDA